MKNLIYLILGCFVCLIVGCKAGKTLKKDAIALQTAGAPISAMGGPPVIPKPADLKIEHDQFVAKLRSYQKSNADWSASAVKTSNTFQIVGTIVALVGGVVGLATGNDLAAYTSLAAATNTGLMSILKTSENIQTSGTCTTYLTNTIREWDNMVLPSEPNDYLNYLNARTQVIKELANNNCRGF